MCEMMESPYEMIGDRIICLKYFKQTDKINPLQQRLEICINDQEQSVIGWASGYLENKNYIIDCEITNPQYQAKEYGVRALILYMNDLRKQGMSNLYMKVKPDDTDKIKLIEQLGFKLCQQETDKLTFKRSAKKIKRVEDSLTEQVHLIMPKHINGYGRLFGGLLMQWVDEVSGVVAKRHAEAEVTTAAIDHLNFKAGAYLNDMVVLMGRITYVGKASMEVRVDTYIEDIHGQRKIINRAYMVMVAIDEEGVPGEVPELYIQSESEKFEWEAGKKRYALRKQRRKEGF